MRLHFSLILGLFFSTIVSLPLQAQVSSDGTTNTTIIPIDNGTIIDSGIKAGDNLFHSFKEFSIPSGREVFFNNASDIVNIFSRVTGVKTSNINGLIRANGDTNLFLINPAGIVFGKNASLDIGGSFFSSTAESIVFSNNEEFSVTDKNNLPLLTINIPLGFNFGDNPGEIIVDGSNLKLSDRTLALLGGNVSVNGNILTEGGRIEIGSVDALSFVALNPNDAGWSLNYDSVHKFQNILLSEAFVSTNISKVNNSEIIFQGKNVIASNNSEVSIFNSSQASGGRIVINASELVEIAENSDLLTRTESTGTSADIIIKAKYFILRDYGSSVDTSTENDGRGGNLTIDAIEFIKIEANNGFNQISTQTYEDGNAGTLRLSTKKLFLRNGSQILSSTDNVGNGGQIIIDARDLFEISGKGVLESFNGLTFEVESGVFAETQSSTAIGDAGDIIINTTLLSISDGGVISVAAVDGSIGRAGKLKIDANSLFLDRGSITAETSQTGGEAGANIDLEIVDLLKLENESLISATASSVADGGNIDIDANFVIAVSNQNSDIIARAQQGTGGNINITTNGIFGIAERSSAPSNNTNDIDPSSEFGLDGTVNINELEVNSAEGLEELPTEVIDVAKLIAQNLCQQGQGSEFVVTGKGGIASSPSQVRDGEINEVDLVEPVYLEDNGGRSELPFARTQARNEKGASVGKAKIVEAQGLIVNDRGNLELVAYISDPNNSPRQSNNNNVCNQTTGY